MSNIVSDLSGLSNNIDGLTQKVKGLSLEDAKLVMNLAEVDAYTQSCTLSNLGYSASAINAANGVMADKVATDADTASKYANLKVTNLLKVAWSKFTAFAMANPWLVGIAAGALAIVGIVKAIDLFTTSMEEASEATTDAISELSSISSEVETLEGKIADLKSQIDGLDPITDEEDIRRLEAETLELENQLAILKEKERLAKEDTDEKARESLGKTQTSRYEVIEGQSQVVNGYIQENGGAYAEVTREEELKNAMKAYDEYHKQRLVLEAELAKMSADDEGYKDKENQIKLLNQQMTDARTHASELALALDEEKAGLSGTTAESKALLDSTNATLSTYSQWLNGINDTTDALNENANAIDGVTDSATKFTKSQMIDTINSMTDGFDVLDDIYADVLDGGTFDFTKLDTSKFSEAFSEITPEYEKFIETVSASPTDIDACQGAFNDLVSAFIDSKGILEGVDEETKQLTIDMLENMGVINAEEVVMSAINAKLNEYADAKSICASAGIDLANATRLEILELMHEQEMSEETRISLWRYQMQKALSNENGINTVYDCVQLENLARAAGYTGSALLYLGKIKALLNKIENDKLDEDSLGYKSVMGQVKNYNGLLQDLLSTEVATTKATVDYGGAAKTASVANKNLKDATDSTNDALKTQKEQLEKTKEALEEQKEEYENLYDAIIWFYDKMLDKLKEEKEGIEDNIESLENLGDAINWFLDGEIDKLDELIDKLKESNKLLQKEQDDMDSALSAINNAINIRIDELQKEKELLEENTEEQEKQLALEEARRKVQEAKSRKVVQRYEEGKGFVYSVDEKAIADAESELAALENELQNEQARKEIDDEIDRLNQLKDSWSGVSDAYTKAMDEIAASNLLGNNWKDIALNPSDKDIGNFQNKYTGIQSQMSSNDSQIEGYEKEKEGLQDLMDFWESATTQYEESEHRKNLATFFGSDYRTAILEGDKQKWQEYVDSYQSYQNQLADVTKQIESIEALKDAWGEAKDAYINSQYEAQLASFFGSDYEYQLLNNSASWRRKFADEYSSICAEIASVEEQIKILNEETASSVESSANKISNATNGMKSSLEGTGNLSKYLWTSEDESALEHAYQRLDALNLSVERGGEEYKTSRDSLAEFIAEYEYLRDSGEITEGLRAKTVELNDEYSILYGAVGSIGEGLTTRLGIFDTSTESIISNVQGISQGVSEVDNALQGAKTTEAEIATDTSNIVTDIIGKTSTLAETSEQLKQNLEGAKNSEVEIEQETLDTVSDIQERQITMVGTSAELKENLDGVISSENKVEQKTDETVTGISEKVNSTIENLSRLQEAFSQLQLANTEIDTESSGIVTDTSELVANIQLEIETLILNVDALQLALSNLLLVLQELDSVTLSSVISAFGTGEEEGLSLLGAINNVITAITGEETGLLNKLTALNETPLDTIIAEFNGDDSLITSIQDVNEAISGNDGLINKINSLTNTIGNINSVGNAFSSLQANVSSCIASVASLKASIDELEDKTITITTVHQSVGGKTHGGDGVGFAKGGIITRKASGELDYIAKELGEDYMIAAQDGEVVISKKTVDANKEIISSLLSADGKSILNDGINYDMSKFVFDKIPTSNWDLGEKNLKNNVSEVKQQTNLNFYGDLSFPNIHSGDDAKLLMHELSQLSRMADQRAHKRN